MTFTSNSIFTNFIHGNNSSRVTFASEVAMSARRITRLGDPTISTDAATKGYVDSIRPSQLYAACECVDPAIIPGFDSPHKQINNFKKIGDVNLLRVSSTGITISTIGVYDIFFSAQVCLIDADTIFEFNIMRGITVIKSFISSYSANSPNEGSLSPSYRIFYNKIAPGEELINVYHSTQLQWDITPPTAITLNRSYLSVFSLQ